jgi:serine/threonine-protein kinase HipA
MSEKTGKVYYNNIFAGRLTQKDNGYSFVYNTEYLANHSLPPVAICFPKSQKEFFSPVLFPFFFGLLAEGANKQIQCSVMKIDENDHFTRLIKTAGEATIGAVTVKEEL